MKFCILLVVLCAGCLTGSAEISKKELKEYSHTIEINGVDCRTQKNKSKNKYEVFTIDFSHDEQKSMDGLIARIAVEIVDKADKTKKTYLVTDTIPLGNSEDQSRNYTGTGYFELSIPHGSFDRLGVTAYAFELGVMEGGTFVPFDAKYNKVKTFDELTGRTATPFPGKYRLKQTFWVDGN